MNAILALEDGTWYRGVAAGAQGETAGEVVFNTSMTGYQEVLTDPSYAGQIVTMTAPQIGNYGVTSGDAESQAPRVAGFVMREESPLASNWRAEGTLRDYLVSHHIVAIGSHVVRIEMAGKQPWTTTTRIVAGEMQRVTGSLEDRQSPHE